MRIALVQQHATHDRNDNLQRGLRALEEAAAGGANLVCYAELAFEPFYPQRPAEDDPSSLAQEVPGPVTEAFAERAAALGVVVVLNLFERDGDDCFDCSPVIDAISKSWKVVMDEHSTRTAGNHAFVRFDPQCVIPPIAWKRPGRSSAASTSVASQSRFSQRSRSPAPSASWMSVAWTITPSSRPEVSTAICRLRPLTFFAASQPRGPPYMGVEVKR